MKRFGLWMTIGILFSLPVQVFAQATSGCSGSSKIDTGTGKKATGGKKVKIFERKVVGKEAGGSKGPKITGTRNAPTGEIKNGKKGSTSDSGKKPTKQTTGGKKNVPQANPDKQ